MRWPIDDVASRTWDVGVGRLTWTGPLWALSVVSKVCAMRRATSALLSVLFEPGADECRGVFTQLAILAAERRRNMAINVQLPNNLSPYEDRHDNLRLGFQRARQIAGIGSDIIHHHR